MSGGLGGVGVGVGDEERAEVQRGVEGVKPGVEGRHVEAGLREVNGAVHGVIDGGVGATPAPAPGGGGGGVD